MLNLSILYLMVTYKIDLIKRTTRNSGCINENSRGIEKNGRIYLIMRAYLLVNIFLSLMNSWYQPRLQKTGIKRSTGINICVWQIFVALTRVLNDDLALQPCVRWVLKDFGCGKALCLCFQILELTLDSSYHSPRQTNRLLLWRIRPWWYAKDKYNWAQSNGKGIASNF